MKGKEETYAFLVKLAECISAMFGKECETVIHEIDGNRIRNLAIYNGHISGREAGSTLSIYGHDTDVETEDNFDLDRDYVNQLVMLQGREIKSTTLHVRGEGYHYALGINYEITAMNRMKTVLESLTALEGNLRDIVDGGSMEGLEEIFASCMECFGVPAENMKKSDRQALVRMLRDRGVFRIQKSVPWVAEKLNVSKYTIYNYLKELEET